MATYSLTVKMTAQANNLIAGLRSASSAARDLGRRTRELDRRLETLERASRGTARQVDVLGTRAQAASSRLDRLGSRGQRTGGRLRRAGADARVLERGLSGATRQAGSLATLLAGGALVLGTERVLEEGNRYQRQMNVFQAVTGATAGQMQRAAWMANLLGNDLTLPTTSAADAAEAMVELAKAGFRTDQAISSTRASLQLAAAAGVNASDSARYLGDIMDQFGLGADQASRASDILAATANNASGGIIDIYYAMRYAGPVAAGLGVSMEDAASAVGMLGKAGILGQTAGTSLRGMMANLAAPTAQMKEGLEALGIEAWDAEGRFRGLRYVIEELSRAQHEMSQQDFTAAVKMAMGKPAMSGAIALAHQGTTSFDALNMAVRETGAAAQITAARGQGLAGAMTLLQKQTRQTGLALYDAMAPGLEYVTRLMTRGLSGATPYLVAAIEYGRDLATLYGPELRGRAREGLGGLVEEARQLLGPLREVGEDALASGLNLLINAARALGDVLEHAAEGAEPVAKAVGSLADGSDGASTALNILVIVANLALSAVSGLSAVLVPVGEVAGALVGAFGALPGPVQTAIASMLLARRVAPVLGGVASTVRGNLTGAWQGLNGQMLVQQRLAAANGAQLGRLGSAFAVLESRVPAVGRMGAAFRIGQGQAAGFAGAVNGAARAVGSGLLSAGRGLVSFMGGPWGVALVGATFALGLLADRQADAAAAAAEHRQGITSLAQALRESNGLVDANVRAIATENLMRESVDTSIDGQQRLVDVARRAKIPMSELVDAYTEQGTSLKALQQRLKETAAAHKVWTLDSETGVGGEAFDVQGRAADDLRRGLAGLSGDFKKAAADARSFNEGVEGSGSGATAYDRLKDAVGALADKTADADTRTRALKDALDLLSGGSISLQAAEARVNSAILNVNESMSDGINRAHGFGRALLNNNGTLNTATRNGQQLYQSLTSLSDAAADASVSAYELSQQNGASLPDSLAAARTQMEKARTAAVKAAEEYGLTRRQAEAVADSLGLMPSKVSLLLETKGMDSTLADLIAVQAEFERLPKATVIRVDSLSKEAQTNLRDLGFTVETIPGTREIRITAPTGDARGSLRELVDRLSAIPDGKDVQVSADTAAAVASLQTLLDKLRATPGVRTVTVHAPTAAAQQALQNLGFAIRTLPDGQAQITVPTQTPIDAVGSIQAAINNMTGRNVGVGVFLKPTSWDQDANGVPDSIQARATGAVVDYFAGGGVRRENHVAQIAPAGSWRVWAEPETQGEAYVPLAASKRPRSKAIVEEVVHRFGGEVSWFAEGGLTSFDYAPPSAYTLSGIASDANDSKGRFSLSLFLKRLKASNRAAARWRKDLGTVARRAGQDVADALAEMGEDGIALTRKMATGSSSYVRQMAKELDKLAAAARASLSDFTAQLGEAVRDQQSFEKNLARLAALGYGDLAATLAEQGDQDAEHLAAEAVKDKKKAAKANEAARAAAKTLAAEDLADLLIVIGAIRTSTTGIHQVADATGLDEERIVEVGELGQSRIKSALGSRATRFLADLAKAAKGLAYADGGVWEPGVYSSHSALIKFAEASTGGEAFIPLSPAKRAAATAVLADVAQRFGLNVAPAEPAVAAGYGHTVEARPAGAVRVVVVREQQPLVGSMPVSVAGTSATPEEIGAEIMRRLRNARRGGRL
jgi:TP901 family phage tail tape measure protein